MRLGKNSEKKLKAVWRALMLVLSVAGLLVTAGCEKSVDSTNKHSLTYLSGDLLPPREWAKCIQNLKMEEWASHNAIGKEILRNYPMYYYGLTLLAIVLFALLVWFVHINFRVTRKNVRTSLKIVVAICLAALFAAACSSVVLLQRPSVFAKLSQEREFLARETCRFEVPRFHFNMDEVVTVDDPFDTMWRALPRLGEEYNAYVKRWHEPAGIHKSPKPGWKKGPNGWYNNELDRKTMGGKW